MSRSVKKHLITKYGGKNRISWKKWKTLINRYNRRVSKQNCLKGEDLYQKDKKLCSWDFDFCKWYYSQKDLVKFPRVKRK